MGIGNLFAVFPSGQIGRPVIYRFVDRSGPVASEKATLGIDQPGQCLKKPGYLWISVDIKRCLALRDKWQISADTWRVECIWWISMTVYRYL